LYRENENRKSAEYEVYNLAFYDPLTHLPNRALCLDRLQQHICEASRYKNALGVFFLDLDLFKIINDSFGHHAGDEVLRETALRLKSILREEDTVARFSGDEFIVLLKGLTVPGYQRNIAEKLIEAMSKPFFVENSEITLGCSIGIASYPEDGEKART